MSEKTKAELNGEFGAFATASSGGYQQGLTKREYFAGLAMQGVLSNPQLTCLNIETITDLAIRQADELLKQLSNEHIKQHCCIVTQEEANEARELLVMAGEEIWEKELAFKVVLNHNCLMFDDEINKWYVGCLVSSDSIKITYPQFKEMLNAKKKDDEK